MSRYEKFAAFRRAKEGERRTWKSSEDTRIYDEVSEDQYKSIVQGRLQRDDFVVDDGVDGYADNGMDDWEHDDVSNASASDEERKKLKKRLNKNTKAESQAKRAAPQSRPDINAYRPVVSKVKEDDFMTSLLSAMDSAPISSSNLKRKPTFDYESVSSPLHAVSNLSGLKSSRLSSDYTSSDPPETDYFNTSDDIVFSPSKKAKFGDSQGSGIIPVTNTAFDSTSVAEGAEMLLRDIDFDASDMPMDIDADRSTQHGVSVGQAKGNVILPAQATNRISVNKLEEEAEMNELTGPVLPSWLDVYSALAVTDDSIGTSACRSSHMADIRVLEEDGSLHFYWLDYLENDGKVYFIGKTIDKETNNYVSCCVTVENIERNLFILPRKERLGEEDIQPSEDDIEEDFNQVRRKFGISSCAHKWVKRKYAFGETQVPTEETSWLKVVYSFNEPQIPRDVSSPNFSRIFGTSTSAFELLVLKRKIMGPCWLTVKKPEVVHKGVSWCKVEATVSDPKDVNPFRHNDTNAPTDVPPLTIMSLSVRAIVNHKENKREIVCVTTRTWPSTHIDDPKPPAELPCIVDTYVRPLNKFPNGFEPQARANKTSKIMPMKNERMLLNQLLVSLNKTDPDIIVGHEFLGVSLDILLHRMRELKPEHWSRIGRFRRTKWPNIGKQGSNLKFLSGRLLCDIASDGAKDMITSTTWSLTEMCSSHLKIQREDIDPDETIDYLDGSLPGPSQMMKFVQHCEMDAHFQMAIASKVQMLPLTKQLTNLAGNSWNKTLNGGRAERNEHILLHEFHRLKYICPDKTWGKKSMPGLKAKAEEGDDTVMKTKGKKDKYKGGLVFEPKKGLWDKYILVMDFNSLYPSIIQEYNIDFTTVERVESREGEDTIPEPPSPDVPQGVLPRLIATLVNRRRQVKSLMKDRSITSAKMLQYDIKQQALKLTANSMYGCLGFEYSRFYARPLAALTTFKGREILTETRELAESMQLDVVYGDTDSVFVNSNVSDLAEAFKTANEFKKHVNERYKLLEIDLDAVFQRLLLLQKKKYAAIKVEEGGRTTIEVKGLDMKRREYCLLSKTVSQYVLDQILSGEDTEIVIQRIHDYLTNIGQTVRNGKMNIENFIVLKRLGKNPEDYPDAKSQPHVQVAIWLKSKGLSARAGDVIPYIFCLGENGQTSKTAQADRARHPDEIRKTGNDLKIDYEHYLSQQVLPPIERLCEPIEGTDRSRLAECLGLDPVRYRSSTVTGFEDRSLDVLGSQLTDKERFKDADAFTVTCVKCDGSVQFEPISDRERSLVTSAGPRCPACFAIWSTVHLQTQLELQIRQHINKYYDGWTTCDDAICRNRTRMMSVYGRRCMKTQCRGLVKSEYSDMELYNQLLYYASLFNEEKILKGSNNSAVYDQVVAVVNINNVFIHTMEGTVKKYVDRCGRRWVDLDGLFSFMKR